MEATFEYWENLEELSITSNWNLENVENIKDLFYKCTKLKIFPGISEWNPIKVKNCEEIFFECQKSLKPTIPSQ